MNCERAKIILRSFSKGPRPTIQADQFQKDALNGRVLYGLVLFVWLLLITHGYCGDFSDYSSIYGSFAQGKFEEASWSELYESDGVSWRYVYWENGAEVVEHHRTEEFQHTGRRSEFLKVQFSGAGCFVLGHYLDYPILTDEASPSLWLRTDRVGCTLGAVVVLPKTIREDTGAPLTVLLRGSSYQRPGEWQKLEFSSGLRSSMRKLVRAVRGEHHLNVDPEGAYLRQLILFVDGRSGTQSIWIDDLQIQEHLPTQNALLAESEKDNRFTPINLLAFRLEVTNASIFPDLELDAVSGESSEPFRIGSPLLSDQNRACSSKTTNHKYSIEAIRQRYEKPSLVQEPPQEKILPVQYSAVQNNAGTPQNNPVQGIVSGSGTLGDSTEAREYQTERGPRQNVQKIEFKGKYLTLDDRYQLGVCAIEYQGEPLSFLKALGFNAIRLQRSPSKELLEEARQLDLWLIAPPPIGAETLVTNGDRSPAAPGTSSEALPYFNRMTVDPIYDSVLVWDLGTNYRRADLRKFQSNTSLIRSLDRKGRPIICHVDSGVSDYTYRNDTDVLLIRRQPFLTSLDLCDYSRWLFQYPKLLLPDFPIWNEIQTQPDVQLLAQCRYFGAVDELPALITCEQMRQQVRLSLAAGCHGLVFASNTPLNSKDRATQYRACALELINRELQMFHVWLSGGSSEDLLDSNNALVSAASLRTRQTALLLPVSAEPDNQYMMGQTAWNNVTFVAPVRDGYNAELAIPGGLQRLDSRRKAGGIHVAMDEISMNSAIFLTQSDWYNQEMSQKVSLFGPRMSELAIRLAKMRIDLFEKTLSELKSLQENGTIPMVRKRPLLPLPEQNTQMFQTNKIIREAESLLKNGDYKEAWLQAERATREIRMTERRFWQTATAHEICRPVLPVSISFATLPAYLKNYSRINKQEIRLVAGNRIQGGDMEDSAIWMNGPWARFQEPIPGVRAEMMLDRGSAYQGVYGLRFRNRPEGKQAPASMEVPPETLEVRIPVQTGELICFQGWIKIPESLENTVDGFSVYDDHGGPALALRFYKETDWRQFAFYRFASYDGEMKFRFSLSGYGEVWLDDVAANVLK